ncbi:major facilitator superfamily domain-containing protein [Aspergillus pseudoustus]|uniref:Major facilitator superfamily domain-containing protein n=1 Tax=Aspergillus pseudoustus TaxID=1810923 RepID=A0ABR4KHX1_9EURO
MEQAQVRELKEEGSAGSSNPQEVPLDQSARKDPESPMNWTNARKWTIIAMVSFITFLTPLASSMFAPGVPEVMQDFNSSSPTLSTFVVSVYVLGFAFGPLIVAPLSEYYGRAIVYNACNALFVVFNIASAVAPNLASLVVFRFLDGCAGVAPISCGSGTIADLMPPETRGVAIALWSLGPLFGPIIGPVVGGLLVEAKGWRWAFWVLSIVGGVASVIFCFVVPETYAPVLLRRKSARLHKTTEESTSRDNIPYVDQHSPEGGGEFVESSTQPHLFSQALIRPMKMLLLSPIVALMSTYVAALYGLLYVLFTTFTTVFSEQYGFSAIGSGLAFLGGGVGMLFGLLYAASLSDRAIKARIKNGQVPKPEDRLSLYLVLPGALTIPAGLFIYGWSTDKHVHWIVPEIGNAVTGFGMIVIVMCVQTYLVDAFTVHAASATAANTVLRSLAGALLPLCGLGLYEAVGLGWGNSILAFIALAFAPIPVLFARFGEVLRVRFPVKL